MKLKISEFKGMLPIRANSKLPPGYASSAINTKLVSGDIEGYLDLGNGFQLAKAAPIFALEQAANDDWLQFVNAELASFALDIRAVPGIIANDPTGRRYITGYNALTGGAYPNAGVFQGASPFSVPQFTNTFYATDASQQGSSTLGAYPYKTFPLGIADPLGDPTASAPKAAGTTTNYEYAQEGSINNAVVLAGHAGTGYAVGDILTLPGGIAPTGLSGYPAQVQVSSVDASGAVTGVSLYAPGFYTAGNTPGFTTLNGSVTLPAATIPLTSTAGFPPSGTVIINGTQTVTYAGVSGNNLTGASGGAGTFTNASAVSQPTTTSTNQIVAASGGSGSGAWFTVTPAINTFNGFTTAGGSNGAGWYANWSISSNLWYVTSSQGGLNCAYSNQAFGLAACTQFVFQGDFKIHSGGGNAPDMVQYFTGLYNGKTIPGGFPQLGGPAVVLSKQDSTFALYSPIVSGNVSPPAGTIIEQTPITVSYDTFYRITTTCVANTAGTQAGFSTVSTVALASNPSAILATVQGFVPYGGDQVGVGTESRENTNGQNAYFENLLVQVTQPASAVTVESTNYVYTYDQQIPGDVLTQESGPSNPSPTIDAYISSTTNPPTRTGVTITIPPCPSGKFISYYNLYRLVLDASGNETYTFVTQFAAFNLTSTSGSFTAGEKVTVTAGTGTGTGKVLSYGAGVLVLYGVANLFQVGDTITGGSSGAHGVYASVALSSVTITYVDSAQDSAIGPDVLISQTWAPPPPNMQGIVAVANSSMCGFFGNVLCFSAPGHPHAWPVENQYAIDTAIQGTVVVDTTVLILSQAYPYTAWGTDPSAYSMSKEVSIQGCTASRSTATHKEYGAIFASGNGFCYYRGQGQLGLIRIGPYGQPPFSYEQFQALAPSSIHGELHDDYYFFFWNNGSAKGGYVLDLAQNGFGIIAIDIHATEAFVDKEVDVLWMVPDQSTYPIPVGGSPVSTAQNIVYQWEYAATQRPRVWTRNDNLFGSVFSPAKARIQSQFNAGTDTITLTLSSEQGTAYNSTVAQQRSFTVGAEPGFSWNVSITVTGTARIKTFALVESAEELNDNG